MEWIDVIVNQAMSAIQHGDVAAISALFFVVALTEAGIPFPFILDTVLFLTSYQTGIISAQVAQVFVVVFLGRQFGAGLLYWLTRLPGNAFIRWLGKRYPSVPKRLATVELKLGSQAIWAITIARLSGLLTVASVASGAIGLRYSRLVLGVALSSLIFDGALLLLGTGIGVFLPHLPPWTIVIGIIIMLTMVWGIHFCVVRYRLAGKQTK